MYILEGLLRSAYRLTIHLIIYLAVFVFCQKLITHTLAPNFISFFTQGFALLNSGG